MRSRPQTIRRAAALAVLLLAACLAGRPGGSVSAAQDDLDGAIERIAGAGDLAKARVGIHVVAVASGRVIHARNATEPFIAASNEKLVTAAAALLILGPGYEFKTALYATGPIRDGTLAGDLVLRGGGDPTIGGRYDEGDAMEVLRRWAGALRARGVRRVAGDVVADDGAFDRVNWHPDWSAAQAWKWYFTLCSATSINDNCATITVKPGGAPGEPAELSAAPSSAPVEFLNVCKTSARRHSIWFEREPDSSVIKVGGYVRAGTAGYSHRVTVGDPALYAASALKQALQEEGIAVGGRARAIAPGERGAPTDAEPLLQRRAALVPVLRTMMKWSHNHYAELVLKTIGAETAGGGSWASGTAAAGRLLREMGFRDSEFELADGSGLSRRNRLSPALLTILLTAMARSEHGETFRSLLARPGEEGTLRNRLQEAPYAGNVRAKSGYLNGVGALSGYAVTRGGLEVAFAILINDSENPPGTYSMRETADALCRAIVDHAE